MTTEEINEYTRGKIKSLLTGSDGKKVFNEINGDKNLDDDVRQRVCCAVGKAVVELGCQKAMASDPNTLLRENTGANTFISAYMGHYAKDYFDAVAQKSITASTKTIRNEEGEVLKTEAPDEFGTAKEMLNAYTTELPKLSKQAAQFMKVSVDVIKERMPQHQNTAIPIVLSSNLVLRGGAPKVTVGLFQVKENKIADRIRGKIEGFHTEVNRDKNSIAQLEKQLETIKNIKGDAFGTATEDNLKKLNEEKERLEKRIKEAPGKLIEDLKKDKDLAGLKFEGAPEEIIKPYEPQLAEYDAGKLAANAVMELANKPLEGPGDFKRELTNQLAGEIESVNEFKETLGKIGNGTISQHVEIKDVPEVDFDKLDQEVKVELAAIKLAKDKEKIQPDMEKLGKLQKKLSDLESSKWERFKAYFSKGGVEGVKQRISTEIEKTKLDIVSKVDTDQLGARMELNKAQLEKLQETQKQVLPGANAYLQAEKELKQLHGELVVDRLEGGMGGGIDEQLDNGKVEQIQKLQKTMNENKAAHETYERLKKHIEGAQGVVEHGDKLAPKGKQEQKDALKSNREVLNEPKQQAGENKIPEPINKVGNQGIQEKNQLNERDNDMLDQVEHAQKTGEINDFDEKHIVKVDNMSENDLEELQELNDKLNQKHTIASDTKLLPTNLRKDQKNNEKVHLSNSNK